MYVSLDEAKRWLPGRFKPEDLPDSDITDTWIPQATADVDSALTIHWGRFNSVTDTPATPGTIQLAARHLVVAYCLRQLAVGGQNSKLIEQADGHMIEGNSILVGINDRTAAGLQVVRFPMGPEKTVGESLVFGEASPFPTWTIQQHEAIMALVSPLTSGDAPNILIDTVRITAGSGTNITVGDLAQMRTGRDYSAVWDEGRAVWLFRAYRAELYNGTITGLQISYEWDARRLVGKSRKRGGRLVYS